MLFDEPKKPARTGTPQWLQWLEDLSLFFFIGAAVFAGMLVYDRYRETRNPAPAAATSTSATSVTEPVSQPPAPVLRREQVFPEQTVEVAAASKGCQKTRLVTIEPKSMADCRRQVPTGPGTPGFSACRTGYQITVCDDEAETAADAAASKWFAAVMAKIKQNWVRPAGRDPRLVTIVHIEIFRDGSIAEVSTTKSSGNAAYDGSVVQAILNSAPLPAPDPSAYQRLRSLELRFADE